MPLHYVAWQNTMALHEIDFPEDRFYLMAGMPTDRIVGILSVEQGIHVDVQTAASQKERAFHKLISSLKPIQKTVDIVNSLIGTGKKIAVASGGTRESVDLQLRAIGLADVFSIRVCAEDTKRHKPDPDVFLRAAELMGVEPAECVVYEDADLGIEAAKAAGMGFVDIRDFHTPARVSK